MGLALPKLSEAEFQEQVIGFAKLHRWRVAHFRKVRVQRKGGSVFWETPVAADGKGFPDLILVRNTRVVAAELKVPGNKPTPEQEAWLTAFREAVVPAYVWFPADWPEIERVLS